MLEVKKIYIDTRFKTSDSRSDSDFTVELPKTINIPEDCIAYINDIVLPVSWTTIDERNNKLYYSISHYVNGSYEISYWVLPTDFKNYNGSTLVEEMMEKMNDGLFDDMKTKFKFNIDYNYVENQLKIEIIDLRPTGDRYYGHAAEVVLFSDEDLLTDKWGGIKLTKDEINSMNQIIRLTKSTIVKDSVDGEYIFYTNIDLHTTRNLYLHSSVLGSYDTLSNFSMDTIIKKISVKANYNELIFDSSMAGFDYLDVSRRSFSRIDFRITDSYGKTINLKNSHWSFSIIFTKK